MLTVLAILVPVAVGVAAMVFAPRYGFTTSRGAPCEINRLEFAVTTFVVVLVALLVTMVWGPSAARAQAAKGYREFWNGSVISATTKEWDCSRDGPCVHEYRCDPYTVTETYTVSVPNADGKGSHTETRYRTVTKYHQCPYATRETSYYLGDNLGRTITIASHVFDEQPVEWRAGHGIPSTVAWGEPGRWRTAAAHLAAGASDPVTKVNHYTNYILPTEGELYKQYSPSMEKYLKAGLLPAHTAGLKSGPLVDFGMTAVKFQPMKVHADVGEWNARLMALNAALGVQRQGDMHVVVVPASRVQNPDDYINALVSYWQHDLGRWGFPKNGIAVVLGANGKKVAWARAKTGMPEGNGEMLAAVSFDLTGKRFDAASILGDVHAQVHGEKVTYTGDRGALGDIVLKDHPFQRACMNCKDATDKGTGYVYLKDSLPVSTGAKVLMFFVVLGIALVLFAVALYFDPVGYCTGRTRQPTRY